MKPNLVVRSGRFTRAVAVASALVLGTPLLGALEAKAQSVPFETRDWKAPGDGLLTLDRNTGLEWLNLRSSLLWDYNGIIGQFGAGGAFEGFRHATANEVFELWSHAGIGTVRDASPVYTLQQLLGITDDRGAIFQETTGHTGTAAPPDSIFLLPTHEGATLLATHPSGCGPNKGPCRGLASFKPILDECCRDASGLTPTHWLVRPSASLVITRALAQFGDLPASPDRATLAGTFAPSRSGNGIDLLHENVVVTIGGSTLTIAGGSLVASGPKFTFSGNIEGVDVSLLFEDTGGRVEFRATLTGLALANTSNPIIVGLKIGDDFGGTRVGLQGTLKLTADDN